MLNAAEPFSLSFYLSKKVLFFPKGKETNAAAREVLKHALFNCRTIQWLIWYAISLLVMPQESVSVYVSFVSLGKVWQTTRFLRIEPSPPTDQELRKHSASLKCFETRV